MAKSKLPFMGHTTVSERDSINQIMRLLVDCGAKEISQRFNGDICVAMAFNLQIGGDSLPFKIPVNVEPIFEMLNGRRLKANDRKRYHSKDFSQAVRIAWRQVLRWIEAQLAFIQLKQVRAEEVFLPYLIERSSGRTLFQVMDQNKFKALPQYEVDNG